MQGNKTTQNGVANRLRCAADELVVVAGADNPTTSLRKDMLVLYPGRTLVMSAKNEGEMRSWETAIRTPTHGPPLYNLCAKPRPV